MMCRENRVTASWFSECLQVHQDPLSCLAFASELASHGHLRPVQQTISLSQYEVGLRLRHTSTHGGHRCPGVGVRLVAASRARSPAVMYSLH